MEFNVWEHCLLLDGTRAIKEDDEPTQEAIGNAVIYHPDCPTPVKITDVPRLNEIGIRVMTNIYAPLDNHIFVGPVALELMEEMKAQLQKILADNSSVTLNV